MKLLIALVAITNLVLLEGLTAQQPAKKIPQVEAKWPGIILSIPRLERMQENRLLVVVRVIATSKVAHSGAFLGTKPVIPPGVTQEELESNRYDGKPFSLASSVMIDDQTLQRYPVLPAVAPPGRTYFPSELANNLLPGQAQTLTIQFTAPPAPPLVEGREPPKQTVSFLLTGAKGPISRLPIPAPGEE